VVSGHEGQVAEGLLDLVRRAFLMLGRIQPELDGGDAIWILWIKTDRGPIDDFASFEEMLRMLKGEDYVGIVPDDMTLGYNHEDFPESDRIHSFAHLWMLDELNPKLIEQVEWYPMPEYSLKRI
jgi:hypothetical protein